MLWFMTTLASRTIAALRAEHDELAAAVAALSPDQLTGPSGASEWTAAQVISHLGSGAEITLAGYRGSVGEAEPPGPDFNQSVWDRWNAMSPADQAAGWLAANSELVETLEALSADQHDAIKVKIGWLPEPLTLTSFAGLRLNEVVLHGWDVRVGTDPAATLADAHAQVLAEHFAGGLNFLFGFLGKPPAGGAPAVIAIEETPFSFVLDNGAKFTTDAPAATAAFAGSIESAMRLVAGRLSPEHTPPGVAVTGNISLDELRTVFPGF
jgi:uncharacterized protein (TIGR03083 family)